MSDNQNYTLITMAKMRAEWEAPLLARIESQYAELKAAKARIAELERDLQSACEKLIGVK